MVKVDISIGTEGRHSGEHYQNQVRNSVSSAEGHCIALESIAHLPTRYPQLNPSLHFHPTHKPIMKQRSIFFDDFRSQSKLFGWQNF